jgi:hypothetical protein
VLALIPGFHQRGAHSTTTKQSTERLYHNYRRRTTAGCRSKHPTAPSPASLCPISTISLKMALPTEASMSIRLLSTIFFNHTIQRSDTSLTMDLHSSEDTKMMEVKRFKKNIFADMHETLSL